MLHRLFLNRLPASCLPLRDNTERPETITIGTNELIGTDPSKLPPALARLMAGRRKKGAVGWEDGGADCGTVGTGIGCFMTRGKGWRPILYAGVPKEHGKMTCEGSCVICTVVADCQRGSRL